MHIAYFKTVRIISIYVNNVTNAQGYVRGTAAYPPNFTTRNSTFNRGEFPVRRYFISCYKSAERMTEFGFNKIGYYRF